MMIACVLSTFNIAKARDKNGAEIAIDQDAFTDTVIRQVPRLNTSLDMLLSLIFYVVGHARLIVQLPLDLLRQQVSSMIALQLSP